jgi:hypothetical protein
LTDRRWHSSIRDVLSLKAADCDTDLYLVVARVRERLVVSKHTQTDIIIPKNSCHPYEHKISGIYYLLRRLHTYPITKEAKDTEINTIKNILRNNEYDIKAINKLPP